MNYKGRKFGIKVILAFYKLARITFSLYRSKQFNVNTSSNVWESQWHTFCFCGLKSYCTWTYQGLISVCYVKQMLQHKCGLNAEAQSDRFETDHLCSVLGETKAVWLILYDRSVLSASSSPLFKRLVWQSGSYSSLIRCMALGCKRPTGSRCLRPAPWNSHTGH